jgi:hypothetical protein
MVWRLAAAACALALLGGCASSETTSETTAETTAEATPQTEPATTSTAEPTTDRGTMEEIVRAWSTNLNAGDNEAVARLFALPAVIAQGDQAGEFLTYEDLASWFARLPCSGTVVSISYDEPDVALAVFELGHRSTSQCDAEPGTLAAARFVFRDGKLVAWQQVPVPDEGQGETTEPVA